MKNVSSLSSRKSDHIRINLEEDVRSGLKTGLDWYRFTHQALPELNLNDIDLSQTMFGKVVRAPVLISSITGGTSEALQINQTLAQVAQERGMAMGVGSQRAAIEHPELVETYRIRQIAPDILLFANLGAIQLNYGYNIDQCRRAVEMIQADALILHLNALQEALQPEGDTNFAGLLAKIEAICKQIEVPVIAKEVGWGISAEAAAQLASAGVSAIDVAGAGGTSWSQVEKYRNQNPTLARVAGAFQSWGIPTAESIQLVRQAAPGVIIFASGGIKDGVDIAKCIALGASLGGMAGFFLKAAVNGIDETRLAAEEIIREVQVSMFACGAGTISRLQQTPLTQF